MRALVNEAELGFDIKGSKSPAVETLDCYGQGIDLTVLFRLRSFLTWLTCRPVRTCSFDGIK